MKCSTKYVGLDVHQATTVASVREESGRVIARAVYRPKAALLAFCGGIRSGDAGPKAGGTHAPDLEDRREP
jgi:hypothetical protein